MDDIFELLELDRKILDVLQDDARLSSQEIAKRVYSSPSSVWRRIRAMEDAGVISGFRVTVDAEKLGLRETILVNVSLDRHTPETTAAFAEFVRNSPQVLECYVGTGAHDYTLKVVAADMRSHFDFLQEGMIQLSFIGKTDSTVVMSKIKETSKVASEIIPRHLP